MGVEGDLVRPRFSRGSRCFAVLLSGAVGGYGWLSTGPEWIGELQLEIRPQEGEGYIWNCATISHHRRQGIFRSLLVGISEVAGREGLKRLWIGSVAIPAEKAVGQSGFRPALRFRAVTLAGLHVMRITESDAQLGRDEAQVLGTEPGWHLRRSRSRRH